MPISATAQDLLSALTECAPVLGFGSGTTTFTGVTTDSRDVRPGTLFIARKGATSDGHEYLRSAFELGATGALVENHWWNAFDREGIFELAPAFSSASPPFIVAVDDTTRGLGLLARWWRRQLALPTVAITGSNGKSSTRELVVGLLTELIGPGTGSIKSHNNHVGLPQTVLQSSSGDRWLTLEAGMNNPGELDMLGSICEPDVAVVLNVGPAHFGAFGSLAKIADAKCELLAHARKWCVINQDDETLQRGVERIVQRLGRALNIRTFGFHRDATCRATDVVTRGLEGISFQLHLQDISAGDVPARDDSASVRLPHFGMHSVANALAAVAAVHAMFPRLTAAEFARALERTKRPEMRQEILELSEGRLLINDAYNANPASMRVGIETARDLALGKGFACVLGEMLELGSDSERFHREIGEHAARCGAVKVIALGTRAEALVAGANAVRPGTGVVIQDRDQIVETIISGEKFPVLLVKGSRGMKLESVVDAIVQRETARRENALSSSRITS